MSYYSMVSVVPFLVIIIVFDPARLQTRYDDALFRFHIFVGFQIFWHINHHLWSKLLGHLPIICIIWIYYLTINSNNVQITWRTPWVKSESYPLYILWHWIAFSPFWLDPYWKLVLNAYIYVPIPQNYQIALIWSPNLHHGHIHIKKMSPRCIHITYPILNTCKSITQTSR